MVLALRAFFLILLPINKKNFANIVQRQYQKSVVLAPSRGSIFDRQGDPLAISIQVPSIAINPRIFAPNPTELLGLAKILNVKTSFINSRRSRRDRYFVWLKRHVDPKKVDEVQNMNLEGLIIIQEPTRFYSAGSAASNIIGMTGLDNSGLFGLERQFNKELRGEPIKFNIHTDARGKYIFHNTSEPNSEKTGNELHLSIDRALQEIASHELEVGLKKAKSQRGFVIVSDPHSGHILALANIPQVDPNVRYGKFSYETFRNNALSDLFEPGSVIKPFVFSEALETKNVAKDEKIFCENGSLKIGESTIHDTHPSAELSVVEALITSSNICTYKLAIRLGREGLFEALKKFGFFRPEMFLSFPGQIIGRISPWTSWKPIRFANISFGHGFVVSGIELVQAMGVFANGGRLMKPILVSKLVNSKGQIVQNFSSQSLGQIITPKTALDMREILSLVVTDKLGTGSKAKTRLYTTAGKTGTAQKVLPGTRGYARDKYVASFLGFTPVKDPHLVIYVYVDEPQEKPYYGGTWAAPIFAEIAEKSLKYLNVKPDIASKTELEISNKKQKNLTF